MQCFKCGSFISEGSRFCGSCGVQVSDPAAATVLTTETDPIVEAVRRDLGGEFEIERELGRGGMGVVFRAREIDLDRVVALKVMPPDMAVHRDLAERFRREARLAAALDHPNIIPIYGVGQSGGTFYIAMKYVEGRGIDAIIDSEGALPVPVVLLVLRAAAGALAFAHQRGIIHRDIKGANILVGTDGRVVVADFGIARAMEASSLTATGSVIGTPHFMSPEQCAGTSLGPQCDQYSLGVVAFQMLTGSVPFDGETMATIITHHFVTPVPDVLSVRGDVPPTLVTVLERAMAKKAEDRFASTHELVEALERVPITDAARRDGEAMLRALAAGESVGRIATTPITRSNPFDLASARAAEAARTPRPATGAGGTRPYRSRHHHRFLGRELRPHRSRFPRPRVAGVAAHGSGHCSRWSFSRSLRSRRCGRIACAARARSSVAARRCTPPAGAPRPAPRSRVRHGRIPGSPRPTSSSDGWHARSAIWPPRAGSFSARCCSSHGMPSPCASSRE